MTAKILDGKAMAQQVRQQLAAKVAENQTEAFWRWFWSGTTKPVKFMTATRKGSQRNRYGLRDSGIFRIHRGKCPSGSY